MNFFSKIFVVFSLSISCLSSLVYAQKDWEEIAQDFVLETKKIEIPNYPHAFNPSIIKWKGRWLLSFRAISDTAQISTICSASESDLGLVYLDDNLEPIGQPQTIVLDHVAKQRPYLLAEDARLISNENNLYLIFSANKDAIITDAGFRMYVAQLGENDEGFFVIQNECLSVFDGNKSCLREKNWVPFIYNSELLLAYYLFPHKIFRPLLEGSECCELVAKSYPSVTWEWGELRGGTPALPINQDCYLGFFHSQIFTKTVHSNNTVTPHYFMGAYLFSLKPPFEIKYISPEPIVGKNFYHGLLYEHYWHPVNVVFPSGLVIHEDEIWVLYGRQDHEIWIAILDKQGLLDSLIPVSTLRE